MLKDEERIAEVKRRIAKKEQQQRLRRRRIISAVCRMFPFMENAHGI